jgi:hypothetical protein
MRRLPVREIARRREMLARGERGCPRYTCPRRFGIATAGDARLFVWIRGLLGSAFANCPCPVVVYDLGLTGDQKSVLVERGVRVCGVAPRLMRGPALFARRPWFLLASPFRYTLFLDADCLVLRPIPEVEEAVRNGELFVCDDGGRDVASRCSPGIAAFYGLSHDELEGVPAFDEGVVGLDPDRHARFLSQWLSGGMGYPAIRGSGKFRDRGPANVAWYSVHRAPPPLRPREVYNTAGELDAEAAIVRFATGRDSVPDDWGPTLERFERAFEAGPPPRRGRRRRTRGKEPS